MGQHRKLTHEIVGVVADARVLNAREEAVPMAYDSLEQYPNYAEVIEVQAHGDPRALTRVVRGAIAQAAPNVPVRRVIALRDAIKENVGQDRLILALSSAFGGLALVLAGFGLLGVLAFAVARRTPEFGVRIALGATTGAVLWSVCREALRIVLIGIAAGVPFVVASGRITRALVFEVTPYGWPVFAIAATVLVIVGVMAALIPAWRAARVDPIAALRAE